MNELREMRDNITIYVDELMANDLNPEIGSFTLRLDQTMADLESLLAFVSITVLHYILLCHNDKSYINS